jgi:hypothetical protein
LRSLSGQKVLCVDLGQFCAIGGHHPIGQEAD